MVSAVGFFAMTVIFDWYIYDSSRSTLLLTTLGIFEFIPTLTIGLLAGALVDRYDRKRVMIFSDVFRTLCLAMLAGYILIRGFNALTVLATVLVVSTMSTFFQPASDALLPSLVEEKQLDDANGLITAGETVAQFVGNPLGGALILFVGVGAGFIFNSVTYALSALCVSLLSIPRHMHKENNPEITEIIGDSKVSLLSEMTGGFRFILSQPPLLILTVSSSILNFFSFYNLYIVIYTLTMLRAGPETYGIMLLASAIGAALGGLVVGSLSMRNKPGIWVPVTWALSGLPLVSLVLFPIVYLAILSMFALGLLTSLVNVTFLSAVQRTVPDEMRGRYFATDQAVGYAAIPGGLVVGGLLIVSLGLAAAFILAGIATLALGLLVLLSKRVRMWGRPVVTRA